MTRSQYFYSLSLFAVIASTACTGAAPHWTELDSPTESSLRGLSVVDDNVVWASGTRGTYLWSVDGGESWTVDTVEGATSFDFRDVHAVSVDTVFLMSAGQDTARIYKTTDRGRSWTLQYDSVGSGLFLNAISFFDSRNGLALGDPLDGRFLVLRTTDGGESWSRISGAALPEALDNEVAFAASGTALITYGDSLAWFVTGGAEKARVFRSSNSGATWTVYDLPLAANSPSRGAFSLTFWNSSEGVVVGGDYASPDSTAIAVAYSPDGGRTWHPGDASVATEYLSGVSTVRGLLVGVGTQGTAVSVDNGITWRRLDTLSLNAVSAARGGRAVWAVGAGGRIVKTVY